MRCTVAAIQMPSEPGDVAANRDRADAHLREAHRGGARLAVLPEMFNTGYGLAPDYGPLAESSSGPTVAHLSRRAREWGMGIAGGFVERAGQHLYDALALCLPDGSTHVYRKRNLVFWERFRFRPGRDPLVVATPWGRIGLAVCADMIYRRVWDAYRGRVDLAIVSAAWPDFACRESGRPHWLLGHIGPLCGTIPARVAADLGVPVLFANQCGPTRTTVPLLGLCWTDRILDRFAGQSRICDGRHGAPAAAGVDEACLIADVTLHPSRGPISCPSTSPSARAASSSGSARA